MKAIQPTQGAIQTPSDHKYFCAEGRSVVVTCAASGLLRQPQAPCCAWVHLVRGGFMENRALGNSATSSSQSAAPHHAGRNVWILTAYAVSGLALFGVLIYYVSAYITQ
jgi:hypothetical protein